MKAQIRLADTGHSEIIMIESHIRGEELITKMAALYKLSTRQIMLITKIGHLIQPQEFLQRVMTQKRADRTVSKDLIQNYQSRDVVPCIYLFNLKELTKRSQNIEIVSERYWMDELEQKLKRANILKPTLTVFEDIQLIYSSQALSKFQKLVDKLNNIRKGFMKLADEYLNLKEIQLKIEQIVERCNNQKKSCKPMNLNFQQFIQYNMNYQIKSVLRKKEQLKQILSTNDLKLRDNSSYFQMKKKYESIISGLDGQINNFLNKVALLTKKSKEQFKIGRQRFRATDSIILQFGNYCNAQLKELQNRSKNNKQCYNSALQMMDQFLQNSQMKNNLKIQNYLQSLQTKVKETLTPQVTAAYQKLCKSYFQFSKCNQKNKINVKQNYQIFTKIKKQFVQYEQQIKNIQRSICQQLKACSSRMQLKQLFNNQNQKQNGQKDIYQKYSDEAIIKVKNSIANNNLDQYNIKQTNIEKQIQGDNQHQENYKNQLKPSFTQEKAHQIQNDQFSQINQPNAKQMFSFPVSSNEEQRRTQFIKKMLFLHSVASNLCSEQQVKRKQYLFQQQNKNGIQNKQKQWLIKVRVPSLDIDYQGTSDLQIINNMKTQKGDDDFGSQFTTEQYMLVEYQRIINLIKKDCDANEKYKNMETIIKKMSDIFYKVYTNKMADEQSKFQSKCSSLDLELVEKIKQLQDQKLISQQLQIQVDQLKTNILKQELQLKDLLEKEKNKNNKLTQDNHYFKQKLRDQTTLNQTIYEQLQASEEKINSLNLDIDNLKEVISLQQSNLLKHMENSGIQIDNSQNCEQNQLKCAVRQHLSKNSLQGDTILQSKIAQLKKQKQKLTSQILFLTKDIEQLQQQNDNLSMELRKIIMKETDQIQVQTDSSFANNYESCSKELQINSSFLAKDEGITVHESIQPGQTALFMPFSGQTYIGVCYKDQDRTLCNVNSFPLNYILDLASFPTKTQTLLSQCSFVLTLKVLNVKVEGSNHLVQGNIIGLFGFEDDSLTIHNYAYQLGL